MSRLTGNEIFELADRFRHGDEEAFTLLYEATARPQYFTALSILKDPDLAEDAVQMVFLQVYKNISTLNMNSNFLAWLSKITYNTCLNILKSRKRNEKEGDEEELLELPDPRYDINPVHQVIRQENRMLILSLLEDLSLEHRTILILRYYQDLKVGEIADIMNISQGTVKSRIHYALKKLGEGLKAAGFRGSEGLLGAGIFLRRSFADGPKGISGARGSTAVRECAKVVSVSCAAGVIFLGAAKTLPQPFIREAVIENPQAYTREMVRINIEAAVKTPASLKAHYENGESLKIIQDSPDRFHAMASRNGRVTISIEEGGSQAAQKDIEITRIDRGSPELLRHVYEKASVRLYLKDDLSGISYDDIQVLLEGRPEPMITVNEESDYIVVPYDRQGSLSLHIKDKAGNTAEIELEAVDITTEK